MNRCVVALLLFGCAGTAFGQITVPQSAIQPLFTPGNPLQIHMDTTANRPTVDVGLRGGPRVYDFSMIKFDLFHTDTIQTVADVSYLAPRFPAAASVLTLPGGDGITFDQMVNEFQNSKMQSLGKYERENDTTDRVDHSLTPELWFSFPVTYGDSLRFQHNIIDTTFVRGAFAGTGTSNIGMDYVVDGYGTLLLPGSLSLECLRIRIQEDTPHTYRSFRFVTPNGLFVLVDSRNSSGIEGNVLNEGVFMLRNSTLTTVGTEASVPEGPGLEQNYPNPFNPETVIRYRLSATAKVRLTIYDVLGRVVTTLVDKTLPAGNYQQRWEASGLPSGVYFYRLETGTAVHTRKMMLMR